MSGRNIGSGDKAMKTDSFYRTAVAAAAILCIGGFSVSRARAADTLAHSMNTLTRAAVAQIKADQIRDLHRQAAAVIAAAPHRPLRRHEARKVIASRSPRPTERAVLDMLRSVTENAAFDWLPEISLQSLLPHDLIRP
ncbi:MAG TPA: hypothetical protein VFK24_08240 [Gammaproteobacteria bacterium]|nr:hypothetical protein [Gammaproteobacteria bacterium]